MATLLTRTQSSDAVLNRVQDMIELALRGILDLVKVGTTKDDEAEAGEIGEYLEADAPFGSVGSWASATPKTVVSRDLPAGDYLVSGLILWGGGAITGTYTRASISTKPDTHDTASGQATSPTMPTTTSSVCAAVPTRRISLPAKGTVYLVADIGFTVGTPVAGGGLRIWRVR